MSCSSPAEMWLGNEVHEIEDWTSIRIETHGGKRVGEQPYIKDELRNGEKQLLDELQARLTQYFKKHYGHLGKPKSSQFTFRPHPTGPEPMHFDREMGRVITAFVNLSDKPRLWRLGPTRPEPDRLDWKLIDEPGYRRDFAPGSMWVVRAECVSHQIVNGDCCVQFNWHI